MTMALPGESNMLASHWMKFAAVFLWFGATLLVLSHCSRLMGPGSQAEKEPPPGLEKATKEGGKIPAAERKRQLDEERKAHEHQRAREQAEYRRLEAILLAMLKTDIPPALDELAEAAAAYKRKLPDLKHLKKQEQWEREAPVKAALARARKLTEEFYAIDREAQQKGREGPTLHSAPDTDALRKRTETLKRGGEELGEFVKALPPLYGKVPESLLLAAIDSIARAALPADAFDPCARDAAACPKPPPPPPPPPAPPAPPKVAGYCIADAPPRGAPLLDRPEMSALVLTRLPLGRCGLRLTGRRMRPHSTYRSTTLLEVEVNGRIGWIAEAVIAPASSEAPGFAGGDPFPFEPPRYRRYRRYAEPPY
jgi:hypothetical protein